jgi:hypothetical protein
MSEREMVSDQARNSCRACTGRYGRKCKVVVGAAQGVFADCQRFGIARLAGRGERVPMVPYACMYTSAATLLLKATLVM